MSAADLLLQLDPKRLGEEYTAKEWSRILHVSPRKAKQILEAIPAHYRDGPEPTDPKAPDRRRIKCPVWAVLMHQAERGE